MHNRIMDLPSDERPYEKFIKYGPSVLSDSELVAVILKTGTTDKTSIELSREVLTDSDNRVSLLSLCRKDAEELSKIKGIGPVKAITLKCVAEISERIASTSLMSGVKFGSPGAIADFYMERFRHLNYEVFFAVFLNSGNLRITDRVITTGTINCSLISSRELFMLALKLDAVKIILIHNHPSGDPAPSSEDIKVTDKIVKAGRLLDISVVDHIIIGDRKYISLAEHGYIR